MELHAKSRSSISERKLIGNIALLQSTSAKAGLYATTTFKGATIVKVCLAASTSSFTAKRG